MEIANAASVAQKEEGVCDGQDVLRTPREGRGASTPAASPAS